MIEVRGRGRVGVAHVRTSTGLALFDLRARGTTGIGTAQSVAADLVIDGPREVYGAQTSNTQRNVTTQATNLTAKGGALPLTFAWAGPAGWTIGTPAALNTAFTAQNVPPYALLEANFTLTVTDARGATATAVVTAQAENFGGGGIKPL